MTAALGDAQARLEAADARRAAVGREARARAMLRALLEDEKLRASRDEGARCGARGRAGGRQGDGGSRAERARGRAGPALRKRRGSERRPRRRATAAALRAELEAAQVAESGGAPSSRPRKRRAAAELESASKSDKLRALLEKTKKLKELARG